MTRNNWFQSICLFRDIIFRAVVFFEQWHITRNRYIESIAFTSNKGFRKEAFLCLRSLANVTCIQCYSRLLKNNPLEARII